ncbi:hypothetical protein ACFLT7_08610 [candidate division KSB1 bacterium]
MKTNNHDLEYYLDKLVDFIQGDRFEADLRRAKKEYFGTPVPRFKDEAEYDLNVSNFLDWYIFDRPVRSLGKTPLVLYVEELDEGRRDEEGPVYEEFLDGHYSLFRLRKKTGTGCYLEDLLSSRIFFVGDLKLLPRFTRNNNLAVRILRFRGDYKLASALDLVPVKVGQFLVDYLTMLQEEGKAEVLTTRFIRSVRMELTSSGRELV